MKKCIILFFPYDDTIEQDAVVLTTNKSYQNTKEIITAIQFYYEEFISQNDYDISNESLSKILVNCFGFVKHNDVTILRNLTCGDYKGFDEIIESDEYLFEDIEGLDMPVYPYDLYNERESMCGKGEPESLYSKWITEDVKTYIKFSAKPAK